VSAGQFGRSLRIVLDRLVLGWKLIVCCYGPGLIAGWLLAWLGSVGFGWQLELLRDCLVVDRMRIASTGSVGAVAAGRLIDRPPGCLLDLRLRASPPYGFVAGHSVADHWIVVQQIAWPDSVDWASDSLQTGRRLVVHSAAGCRPIASMVAVVVPGGRFVGLDHLTVVQQLAWPGSGDWASDSPRIGRLLVVR